MSAFHPDEMTLMNYAAGSLNIPQALAVRVHLGYCLQCRIQTRQLTHVGGAMLEKITPASSDAEGFDKLMVKIESEQEQPSRATNAPSKNNSNPLLRYLPAPLEQLPWQRQTNEIAKFDLTRLINAPGFQVALQKIKAGARVPTHTHKGFEYTVILSGGFSDELGVYHAGDFIARDTSHKHSPTALQNEDCICLTVLNAPLKFTGWQRIFNPFMALAWR
jgi:putative transcriptional regulator